MGQFPLPIHVSCVGCTIQSKEIASSPGVGPTISLGLNLDIPIHELISLLMAYQRQTTAEQAPADLNVPTPKFAFEKSQHDIEPQDAPSQLESRPELSNAGWERLRPMSTSRVKVYNLMKSVKARDIKCTFEKHVGPIEECVLTECVASIQFVSAEHARLAVDRFDGGILEMSTDKHRGEEEVVTLSAMPWHADGASLRRMMETSLWPLKDSQLRRGDGWLTLFQISKAKEAKKSDQQESHQVDFKGSILSVQFDTEPRDEPRWDGIVINGVPMVL
ncbi:unnamed protein product [Effrenium voratum]|nr:unnamed protein product [Effrenium voratum]